MESDFGHYTLKLLYEVPNLADECCLLLNHEWKRSIESRMRGLNLINDRYPINIVLVKESSKERTKIVGHCRVSSIQPPDGHGPSVFLESVIISPELRGQGFGRYLIEESERYLSKRGIRSLYLYTMGQEKFYGKLGYTPCQAVDVFARAPESDISEPPKPVRRRRSYIGQNGRIPPPLPPSPLPPSRIPANERSFFKGSKSFMRKIIFPVGEFRP